MKKLLLTLIVSLAFGGAVFAQYAHDTNWPDFSIDPYEDYNTIICFAQIDGEYITIEDNWEDFEIAAFVGDECRGHAFMDDYTEDGDPYPSFEFYIYFNGNGGETLNFKLYDHSTGTLYEDGVINIDYTTGEGEHTEIIGGDYENAVVFSFTSPETESITKDIIGYGNNGGWYLISSPVGDVPVEAVENLTINEFDLYYFDQKGDADGHEWMNYELGNNEFGFTTLEAGKGYLYANIADVTLTFPGTAYTGDGTFPLDYYEENEEVAMRGWNLVGNPFNYNVTVDRPFYRMENNNFEAYGTMGEIEAKEGVLVFTDGTETESVTFAPVGGGKNPNLALSVSNGSKVLDRAVIGFGQGGTLPKIQFNPNSTKLYINLDNEDYAVVRSEGMGEMPVSFKAESNGAYSLNLSSENVDFAYLHLIDNLTGADQDLLVNPSYSFEASTTDYASRFRLVFATGNEEDSFAFFSNGNLLVNNEGNATLQVVDVTGRIIMSESINGCASVNIDAAPGVYMVRLLNGDNMKVQKVVK